MSNALSVSAVTASLRNLLDRALRDEPLGTTVTTRVPDKARDTVSGNQLNVFLYHATLDAAFRNMPVPGPVRDGGSGRPPLPLCLHYLLTAYGADDDDVVGHRVLGGAMSVMHDHTLLSAADIGATLGEDGPVDLQHQREGLRITYQSLSLEEMSKLWTTFQTQYRISAAYEVSVVLIDSVLPSRSALPVLRRGPDDAGADVLGGLVPPFPTIDSVTVPDPRGAAALGDTVVLAGHHLGGATRVRLAHPLLSTPHELPVAATATERSVSVILPVADAAVLPSGSYTVTLVVPATDGGPDRTSNSAVIALGPRITRITPPSPVPLTAAGSVTLTVTLTPDPRPAQQVRLLLGDHEFVSEPASPAPGRRDFVVRGLRAGNYLARLRIDGFDSRVVEAGSTPLRFDPAVGVVIT